MCAWNHTRRPDLFYVEGLVLYIFPVRFFLLGLSSFRQLTRCIVCEYNTMSPNPLLTVCVLRASLCRSVGVASLSLRNAQRLYQTISSQRTQCEPGLTKTQHVLTSWERALWAEFSIEDLNGLFYMLLNQRTNSGEQPRCTQKRCLNSAPALWVASRVDLQNNAESMTLQSGTRVHS